jgi:hypothetical protein
MGAVNKGGEEFDDRVSIRDFVSEASVQSGVESKLLHDIGYVSSLTHRQNRCRSFYAPLTQPYL